MIAIDKTNEKRVHIYKKKFKYLVFLLSLQFISVLYLSCRELKNPESFR